MAPQWPLMEAKDREWNPFSLFHKGYGYIVLLNFSPSFSYISRIHS